ncbi:hypothetical protein TDB9533_03014 [Thalassocella blandensis]|nr:hypothetical protein TDB9533_03014 [Thalassocella blandensis]
MKIEMLEFSSTKEIVEYAASWNIALVGSGEDDRSKASIQYAGDHCDAVVTISYDPDEMQILAGDDIYQCYQIPELIKGLTAKQILLDATTLGVPELGLLLKHLYSNKKVKASILYVEPGSYGQTDTNSGINSREFNLSSELKGYKGIPSLTDALDIETPNSVVFFLGFEGYRLQLALEELNIIPHECSLVFGVPSFRSGWEMNAFDNNIKSINDNDLDGRVFYCGADNPAAVLYQLQSIRSSLGDDHKMTVVPIGSKPHSIGALCFCASDKKTSVLYDHPVKAKNRSGSVGSYHLYKIV